MLKSYCVKTSIKRIQRLPPKSVGYSIVQKNNFTATLMLCDRTYVLPWLYDYLHDLRETLGTDPFPYGLERNRKTVEKYFEHAIDQNLIATRPRLEDLFLDLND